MNIEIRATVYFDTKDQLKTFNQSISRILTNPESVNVNLDDFSEDEVKYLKELLSETRGSSFFNIEGGESLSYFYTIIARIKERRSRAGFRKCGFPKKELEIWQQLYTFIPIFPE